MFLKFRKIHKKTPVPESKVVGLRPATLLKKRLRHRCFPMNFAKLLRTPFYRTPPADCFCLPYCVLHPAILTLILNTNKKKKNQYRFGASCPVAVIPFCAKKINDTLFIIFSLFLIKSWVISSTHSSYKIFCILLRQNVDKYEKYEHHRDTYLLLFQVFLLATSFIGSVFFFSQLSILKLTL